LVYKNKNKNLLLYIPMIDVKELQEKIHQNKVEKNKRREYVKSESGTLVRVKTKVDP
jgi:hypothetical protein